MKIIVISNYDVIREGIVSIIAKHDNISIQFIGETIKESMLMIKREMADVVMLNTNNDSEAELNLLDEIRALGINTKFIILDFCGSSKLFVKALKCGVQGYISGRSSEEEIVYVIDQVSRGKKYFDSCFVDYMVNENSYLTNKLELLTIREREILGEIAKGLSNRKISEEFSITEHTVKKHINHIFEKLNISDRTEAALYANKYGMVNK